MDVWCWQGGANTECQDQEVITTVRSCGEKGREKPVIRRVGGRRAKMNWKCGGFA